MPAIRVHSSICIAKPRNSIKVPMHIRSHSIHLFWYAGADIHRAEESNGNGRVHMACFAMPRDETWVRVTEEWAQFRPFVAPGLVIVTVLRTRSEIAPRSRGILYLRIAADFRWSQPKPTASFECDTWHPSKTWAEETVSQSIDHSQQ